VTSEDALETAVDRVSALLDTRIGLRPESSLRGRLRRSIRDELTAGDRTGNRAGDQECDQAEELDGLVTELAGSEDRLQSLVNRVTVQESGFFRHPDHFVRLANDILPGLRRPLTVWSAGCANGQEAYSLAMVLDEQGVEGSVVATDLSTGALQRTADASYTLREATGISSARRRRYLAAAGDRWQITPELRSRVTTMRHNLVAPLPDFVGQCQVVFCRNVLIYFSADHARTFLHRLADTLAPGAVLFLGGAESLWQTTDRFRAVRLGDSFVYERRDRAGPARATGATGSGVRPPATSTPTPTRSPAQTPAPVARPAGATRPAAATRPVAGARPAPVPATAEDLASARVAALADAGRAALAAGDHAAAVVTFRQWVYLAPDDPLAALHLGLALEAGGHHLPALRAFGVSRAVLHRIGTAREDVALGGYAAEELVRLLDSKQQSAKKGPLG
jgi:chemotaxis methyl-accepting protein methylase